MIHHHIDHILIKVFPVFSRGAGAAGEEKDGEGNGEYDEEGFHDILVKIMETAKDFEFIGTHFIFSLLKPALVLIMIPQMLMQNFYHWNILQVE